MDVENIKSFGFFEKITNWSNVSEKTGWENKSVDVMRMSCFEPHFDRIACVRSTVLCFLYGLTALLSLGRLIKFHLQKHGDYYPFAIFYASIIQCLIGAIEWALGWQSQAALSLVFLRCLQLLVISHFYLVLCCRVCRRSDQFQKYSLPPLLCFLLGYVTAVWALGLINAQSPWFDCYAYYWLMVTIGEITITQVVSLCCVILLMRLAILTAEERVKQTHRRDLLILMITFELSAGLDVAFHIYARLVATDESGCSGIFNHHQMLYSTFKLSYESIVFLAPAWAMIWVFRPLEPGDFMSGRPLFQNSRDSSDSGIPNSMQDPVLVPSPMVRQWRYRRPMNPRMLQQWSGRRGYKRFGVARRSNRSQPRKIASLPQFPSQASPRLAPIPEESTSRSGSEVGSPPSQPSSVYTMPIDVERGHSSGWTPSSIN